MRRLLLRLLMGRWLPDPPISVPDPPGNVKPDKGIEAINAWRARNGLRPVIAMTCLSVQAYEHSVRMHRTGRLSHDGFSDRLSACEFQSGSENVAAGQGDWGEATADWMTSAGHRRNMLGDWDFCGVGQDGLYYTALFSRR